MAPVPDTDCETRQPTLQSLCCCSGLKSPQSAKTAHSAGFSGTSCEFAMFARCDLASKVWRSRQSPARGRIARLSAEPRQAQAWHSSSRPVYMFFLIESPVGADWMPGRSTYPLDRMGSADCADTECPCLTTPDGQPALTRLSYANGLLHVCSG